jgi:hypothetical protein
LPVLIVYYHTMSPSALLDETRPLISESIAESSDQRSTKGCHLKLQIATLLLSYFAETILSVFAYPFLAQVRLSEAV